MGCFTVTPLPTCLRAGASGPAACYAASLVGWADVRKPNSLGRSLMLGFLTSAQPTDSAAWGQVSGKKGTLPFKGTEKRGKVAFSLLKQAFFVGRASARQGRLINGLFHGNTVADLPSRRCIRPSSVMRQAQKESIIDFPTRAVIASEGPLIPH